MNKQREAVYGLRNQLLKGLDQKELIADDYFRTCSANARRVRARKNLTPTSGTSTALKQLYEQFGLISKPKASTPPK